MKRNTCWALILGMMVSLAGTWASAAETAQDKTVSDEAKLRATCQNNLKQLGIVMKMFAGENKDSYPPMDPRPGYLVFVIEKIFPEYISDPRVMACPADQGQADLLKAQRVNADDAKKLFDKSSYWYLGYMAATEEDGLAFVEAYKSLKKAGKELPKDIELPQSGNKKLHAIREGIERFLITDINNPAGAARLQSSIPVLVERPGFHKDGANVIYMDGHVEFLKYPGKYPMTERFIKALKSLDELRAPTGK